MSSAPTAASILKALDAHRIGAQMAALAALDSAHQDAVRLALSRVKGRARIDLRILIDTVCREIADRSTGMSPAERAEFRQFIRDSNARLRAECESRGIEPSDPAAFALSLTMQVAAAPRSTARYDDDLDDDVDDAKPRRKAQRKPKVRSLPRRRLLRLERAKRKPEEPPRFLGPRLFAAGADDRPFGQSIDFNPRAQHFDPPWLIRSPEDEDCDDELVEA